MPTGIYDRPGTEERLSQQLVTEGDCLIFTGDKKSLYGRIRIDGRQTKAHRAAYMLSGKVLAKHKRLHHRCENKRCCNPEHLRLTTKKNHMHFHRQERCKRGHPMVETANGYRYCRTCSAGYVRAHYYRTRA